MSGIKKKFTLLFLTASICLSAVPAFADNTISTDSADMSAADTQLTSTEVKTLTIDGAIAYAKEHSSNIAALKASEANADYSRKEARLAYKNMRKATIGDINSFLLASGYSYRASLFNYRIMQRNTLLGESTLESNVINAFYTYLNNEKKVKLAESSLATAKERTGYAELKFNNGAISANDLENFRLSELKAQNDLNAALRTKDYSMLQLKSAISYPLENELRISGEFERRPRCTITPEQALVKAQKSLSWVNAEETLALAQFKRDKYHSFYGPASAAWYSAETEFSGAQVTYNTSIEKIKLGIYSAYNQMITLYETLDYLDKNIEYMQNQADVCKLRYDLGLITADDYLEITQQLDSLRNTLSDTELNAYLAEVQYRTNFDYENTVFEEEDPLL